MSKKGKSTINNGLFITGGRLQATTINFNSNSNTNFEKLDETTTNFSREAQANSPVRHTTIAKNFSIPKVCSYRLFIIFAVNDEALANGLMKQIQVLSRQGLLQAQLPLAPGANVESVERAEIASADAIVALLSADFFADKRCMENLKQALERNREVGLPLVPVRLRAVNWERTEIGGLRPTPPEPEVPIAQQRDRDAAWKSVVDDLLRLLQL